MRFVICLALLLPLTVQAEDNQACFDPEPSLEQEMTWELDGPARADFYLPSRNASGSFLTKAAAHLEWDGALHIRFDHLLPPGQVGLPYTVHRIQVQMGNGPNAFLYDQDLTFGCQESGLSFFPGQVSSLPSIKVPAPPEGPPAGQAQVLVRIWGRL